MLDIEDVAIGLGVGLSAPIGHLVAAIRETGLECGSEEFRGLYVSEALSRVAVGDADDFANQDPTGEATEQISNICSAGDEVLQDKRNAEQRRDSDFDDE